MAIATAVTLAVPQGAAAQCTEGPSCTVVRPDGKGIIGLGLIGIELGLIIPALAGVRDEWWPYLVFPLIGAVAGGIGGFFVEEATRPNDAEVDVALMAIGMVLIVPTIVGTLALTAYQPPEEAAESDEDYEPEEINTEDSVEAINEGDSSGGAAEPAPEGGSSDEFGGATSLRDGGRRDGGRREPEAVTRMREMLSGGRGLLRFRLGEGGGPQVLLATPLPYSASSYTAEERASLLLNPANDFIVPVVSASF